jgi:hypothetical protein
MKTLRLFTAVAALGGAIASSQALLVADNGTNVGTGDDSGFAVTLGGTFNLYGTGVSTLYMTTNGYIATTNSPFDYSSNFPVTGHGIIAPFLDDLDSRGTGYYDDFGSTADYDQFTWNTQHFSGTGNIVMQAVLFRNNVTVSGFNFLAGDIAFSYDSVSESAGATFNGNVGLNDGAGGFIVAPGTGGSQNTFGSALPMYPTTGQFFLFRSNGQGGYNASIASAVPEPASMSVLALGALALLRRRSRK